MVKIDVVRYAIDYLMDEGFICAQRPYTTAIKEKLNLLYDQLTEKGSYVTASKLANMIIMLDKQQKETDKRDNKRVNKKKNKRGVK